MRVATTESYAALLDPEAFTQRCTAGTAGTAGQREGVATFIDTRSPRFRGR